MLKYLFAKHSAQSSQETPTGAVEFSYHKDSAIQALLAGFLMAAVVEATVIHILLAMWNHWVATAATLSTVWFGLQVVAQIRAVSMRPILIHNETLVLRNGAFDIAEIPFENIASVMVTSESPDGDTVEIQPFNVTFPATHNVIVRLKQPTAGTILNRSSRDFQVALIALDTPDEFARLVNESIPAKE